MIANQTLYHVALIEADWLFDDIFGIQLSDSELPVLFPFADRDSGGQLATSRASRSPCTSDVWPPFGRS